MKTYSIATGAAGSIGKSKGSTPKTKGRFYKQEFLTLAEKGHLAELTTEPKMKLSYTSLRMRVPERLLRRIKNKRADTAQCLQEQFGLVAILGPFKANQIGNPAGFSVPPTGLIHI